VHIEHNNKKQTNKQEIRICQKEKHERLNTQINECLGENYIQTHALNVECFLIRI
jgi:hypothetical protein